MMLCWMAMPKAQLNFGATMLTILVIGFVMFLLKLQKDFGTLALIQKFDSVSAL